MNEAMRRVKIEREKGRGGEKNGFRVRSTTVLAVRHNEEVAIGSDGQITFGGTIMKQSANKIRKVYGGKVLLGFAGGAADALSLFERLDEKLEQYHGDLYRSIVALAKDWRTDRFLRRLDAMLIAVDSKNSFIISGNGDLLSPDDGIVAIGSGGPMALAAARALVKYSTLSASEVVKESLTITSEICIYTNEHITVEKLKI